MNPLFIIPARGGSKGIPKKNSKLLNNIPLIFYSINVARKFVNDSDICVTTDDLELIELVKRDLNLNIPFTRPDHLASDNAGTYEVLLHAIEHYEKLGHTYDTIILLQPTSPLRTEKNIAEAIELYKNSSVDMVVSVKESSANPYYNLFEENENGYLQKSKLGSYNRRQDCPSVYEYNGAIYIINVTSLKQSKLSEFKAIKKYVMPEENSVDIDTPLDWKIAEFLIQQNIGV